MSMDDSSAATSHEVHQLFFALWPGDDTRSRLAGAAERLRAQGANGRWIAPERYHLTLHFLGRYAALGEDLLARACAAAERVSVGGFELGIDRAGSFALARIPAWLGTSSPPANLQVLVDTLGEGLRARGLRVQGERFMPHVTVLRDAAQPLQATLPEVVRWRVEDFVLIDSRIQPSAAYRIVGRWRLR